MHTLYNEDLCLLVLQGGLGVLLYVNVLSEVLTSRM